jgi:superfamily II DNA/RNA helicase
VKPPSIEHTGPEHVSTLPDKTFAALGLDALLLSAVNAQGYVAPTPVQCAAIPAVLRGDDLWASAQTGSGKTAAFVLPMLQRLCRGRKASRGAPRALIIAPTRELAQQIGEAVRVFSRGLTTQLGLCVAVGGVPATAQEEALDAGADVVVATPGRLRDLQTQGALTFAALELLVLDEADRLLSLGFAADIGKLVAEVPSGAQRLLFSATFPPKVVALAERMLHAPTRINLDAGRTPDATLLEQRAIAVDSDKREGLLLHLLEEHAFRQVLVFVSTRDGADQLVIALVRAGIDAWALHGDLSQGARSETLRDFRDGRIRVLFATDLAARGIDVAKLPAVVNYDLPRSAADYTHRIGRAGRAGEPGVAISFVTPAGEAHFRLIEKRHQLRIAREVLPGFAPTEQAPVVRDAHGGVKGKRKSKKDKLREAAARSADKPHGA